MGTSEKFCLRWNDFEANISSAFYDLKEEKDFADVTLVCAEGQVDAHKVILAASSPFFKRVLKENPHSHPLIFLKGIKLSDVEAVLKFVYHGEVNVEEANLTTFLAVAEEVEVKGLVQDKGNRDFRGGSSMQSPVPKPRPTRQFSAPRSNMQSLAQTYGQTSSQTEQGSLASVNNNGVAQVKVESEDTFSAPVLGENRQQNYLGTPNNYQVQDDGMQAGWESGGGVEPDLDGYSSRLTEGENKGRFQCHLCGKISRQRHVAAMHVENIHFPGSFEYQCDQCDQKFSTKNKWAQHRTLVHSKKSK